MSQQELTSMAAVLLFILALFAFLLPLLPPASPAFEDSSRGPQLLFPRRSHLFPLPRARREGKEKKSKRSLCSPTLSITPCLRLRTAARLLVKPRRVPPQKSARLDDPSRSPSRATSATLPHVSPINLPPGTPPAASRPLLCE